MRRRSLPVDLPSLPPRGRPPRAPAPFLSCPPPRLSFGTQHLPSRLHLGADNPMACPPPLPTAAIWWKHDGTCSEIDLGSGKRLYCESAKALGLPECDAYTDGLGELKAVRLRAACATLACPPRLLRSAAATSGQPYGACLPHGKGNGAGSRPKRADAFAPYNAPGLCYSPLFPHQ